MSSSHQRALRSKVSKTHSKPSPSSSTVPNASIARSPIKYLPAVSGLESSPIRWLKPGSVLPSTKPASLRLLRQKQARLASTATTSFDLAKVAGGLPIQNALISTLIFAQHEAGTAVCIDPKGWVLTCSHCIGESEEEWQAEKRKWLLYFNGLAVLVECRIWDARRDLALCKIVAVEGNGPPPTAPAHDADVATANFVPHFSFILPSQRSPRTGDLIVCIGQPGQDDLESATARRTKYNLVAVSEGHFRGLVKGADPQDNSEIGALKHDAWTYWGHSGAPLVQKEGDGGLVGLHSSWDDQTAMRHGIPHVAIKQFLDFHLEAASKADLRSSGARLNLVTDLARQSGGQKGENPEKKNEKREIEPVQSHVSSKNNEGTTTASAIMIEDDSVMAINDDL